MFEPRTFFCPEVFGAISKHCCIYFIGGRFVAFKFTQHGIHARLFEDTGLNVYKCNIGIMTVL